jgi:small subunit ribosomal protein S8
MTMTDPIADFLTRIRNANAAHHDSVTIPYSKLKARIAEILQAEGYIAGWSTQAATVGSELVVTLKYGPERQRSLAGVKRVSKPGLRVYATKTDIPRVLGGLGVVIVSTSHGIMTGSRARQAQLGGEVLAYVW